MAEMASGAFAAEHRGQEQALIDFLAALVALEAAVVGGDLLGRGHQAGNHAGGADHEILDPHETGPPHGQRVVAGVAVTAKKLRASLSRPFLNGARRGTLALIAPGLGWQPPEQARALL